MAACQKKCGVPAMDIPRLDLAVEQPPNRKARRAAKKG